jgi:Fervidolysin N-terminal prodomain
MRIIVKFKPIPRDSTATLDGLCEQVLALIPGARLVRPVSRSGRAVFQLEPTADVDALIGRLSRLDSIDYAEPDLVDRPG